MLSEQERMNNAFKEMLFHEDQMAKKYADLAQKTMDPKLKQVLQGMEQGARNHYGTLSQTMGSMGIV